MANIDPDMAARIAALLGGQLEEPEEEEKKEPELPPMSSSLKDKLIALEKRVN